jgi:hypothetical protein
VQVNEEENENIQVDENIDVIEEGDDELLKKILSRKKPSLISPMKPNNDDVFNYYALKEKNYDTTENLNSLIKSSPEEFQFIEKTESKEDDSGIYVLSSTPSDSNHTSQLATNLSTVKRQLFKQQMSLDLQFSQEKREEDEEKNIEQSLINNNLDILELIDELISTIEEKSCHETEDDSDIEVLTVSLRNSKASENTKIEPQSESSGSNENLIFLNNSIGVLLDSIDDVQEEEEDDSNYDLINRVECPEMIDVQVRETSILTIDDDDAVETNSVQGQLHARPFFASKLTNSQLSEELSNEIGL